MRRYIILILLGVTFFLSSGQANWSNLRDYETILVRGNQLPQLLNVSINQLFLYSFNQQLNLWQQITFQIDEKDGGSSYFITPNQVLDSNDEILFMAYNAGDKAFSYQWIEDENSRNYLRYEIEISDPLSPEDKKYVYVYRSQNLNPDPDLPVYLEYINGNIGISDSVKTPGYFLGHNEYGIIDRWKIPETNGGNNKDILDRQKARVKGKYYVSFNKSEQNLRVDTYRKKLGPIRIIREVTYKMTVSVMTVTVGTFKYHIYPYKIVGLGTNKTLSADYNISLIRQSFDLNYNAIGMHFNNPSNVDVVIDGNPDTVDKTIFPLPEINWYMCSGVPGTLVLINEFTPLAGSEYRLYYHDNKNGGTDDGTSDTGYDNRSYGDVGILFTGNKIVGQFSLPFISYFLPANQPREVGLSVVENYQNPLTINCLYQTYVTPVEIALSLPDTMGFAQIPINIPLYIGDLQGENVTSCDFTIKYDSTVLRFNDISVENSLVENWNPPIFQIAGDSIVIHIEGATPLDNSGVLFYLTALPIGDAGQESPLLMTKAQLNQGYPFTIPTDGNFITLPTPEIPVWLPDTTAWVNSSITVPIKIGDVTDLGVTSCQIEITFDKTVLYATLASVEQTLAQEWSIDVIYDKGLLKIDMNGEMPIIGAGDLVWITFDVTGENGESSTLHFRKMVFNNGAPIAQAVDGNITIGSPPPQEVVVEIPDTTVLSGIDLRIPILTSSLTNLGITFYRIYLSFDDAILQFNDVDLNGSISEGWNPPLIYDLSNRVIITGSGGTPLVGEGELLFLNFTVIGASGTNTDIHFDDISMNSPNVFFTTYDGTITVQGVVPVELSSFTATATNACVILNWSTVSERNNYGFFIQRKMADLESWETIKFIKRAGTTTVPKFYHFTDTSVNTGKYYYRLKQLDIDGAVHYSQILEVEVAAPKSFVLYQNYPNPFNGITSIRYEIPEGIHKINLVIYNILGQPVRTLIKHELKQAGSYQISWDGVNDTGDKVPSGIYYLQFQAGSVRIFKKLIFLE